MQHKVYIMSGISGSGKTWYINNKILPGLPMASVKIVSANDFFTDKDGNYKFDQNQLGYAHALCFAKFISALQDDEIETICVDNCNSALHEISPYIIAAYAFGYDHEIITINTVAASDFQLCANRNVHGCDLRQIELQHRRMVGRRFPKHWKRSYAYMGVQTSPTMVPPPFIGDSAPSNNPHSH